VGSPGSLAPPPRGATTQRLQAKWWVLPDLWHRLLRGPPLDVLELSGSQSQISGNASQGATTTHTMSNIFFNEFFWVLALLRTRRDQLQQATKMALGLAKEGSGANTCPTALDPVSQPRRALVLPCVPQLRTPPPHRGGLQCCNMSHSPGPASLLRRASVLSRDPWLSTRFLHSGGLECSHVSRGSLWATGPQVQRKTPLA
jgi:hypothetical protein